MSTEIRGDYPVTFFKNVKSTKPVKVGTLSSFFETITSDPYREEIRIARAEDLRTYNALKSKLPGICLGEFSKRASTACQSYSPCIGFDIDKIKSEADTLLVLAMAKELPYVYAAFPSVSGVGLRIFVWTNATIESHKEYYNHIVELLESDLATSKFGAIVDPATKDISRLWYYAPIKEGEFYKNESSKVISMPSISDDGKGPEVKRKKPKTLVNDIEVSNIQKINLCHEIIKARKLKGRNDTVMQLSRLASEYGISKDTILSVAMTYEDRTSDDPFNEKEIKAIVAKNIEIESRNAAQLLSYANKTLSSKRVNQILGKKTIIRKTVKQKKQLPVEGNTKFARLVDFLQENFQIRRNLISKDLEIRQIGKSDYTEFNVEDIECILYENGFTQFFTMLKSIVGSTKYVEQFNPLQEYLNELPEWNNDKPDYIFKLANYVETDDQHWFRRQFKKMLVRNLACSLGYIPYNKQVFCLVGRNQNVGKTSFIRYLCPGPLKKYWQEDLNLKDKDSLSALATNLFILLDEVQQFGHHDLNTIKGRISLADVKMRLPFAKSAQRMDRIVNFFATTNHEELLVDDQNVRWLVFKALRINHDDGRDKGYSKNVDIDLVWAQAYFLLQDGFDYKLSKEDIEISESRNREHFSKITHEHELIQSFYQPGTKEDHDRFMTATSILTKLDKHHGNSIKLYSNKLGSALTKLGYEKAQKRVGGSSPVWGYYVKEIEQDQDTMSHL